MDSYRIFLFKRDGSTLWEHGSVDVNHLCPAQIVKDDPILLALLELAVASLQPTDGPRPGIDLNQLTLTRPSQ